MSTLEIFSLFAGFAYCAVVVVACFAGERLRILELDGSIGGAL